MIGLHDFDIFDQRVYSNGVHIPKVTWFPLRNLYFFNHVQVYVMWDRLTLLKNAVKLYLTTLKSNLSIYLSPMTKGT